MPNRAFTTEETVRRGREIYEREARAEVEAAHDGEFVDVTTGSWEVDADDVAASERALANNPEAVLYFARVGRPAAYRLGTR